VLIERNDHPNFISQNLSGVKTLGGRNCYIGGIFPSFRGGGAKGRVDDGCKSQRSEGF
jgi:hypothetical protein